jgi:hypothetical protein
LGKQGIGVECVLIGLCDIGNVGQESWYFGFLTCCACVTTTPQTQTNRKINRNEGATGSRFVDSQPQQSTIHTNSDIKHVWWVPRDVEARGGENDRTGRADVGSTGRASDEDDGVRSIPIADNAEPNEDELPNNDDGTEGAIDVATVAVAVSAVVAVAVVETVAVAEAAGVTGVLEFNVDTVCFKRSRRRKRRCSTSRARSSSACLRASMETVGAPPAAAAAAAAGAVDLVGLVAVTDRAKRSSGAPLGVTTREDAEEVGNESKSVMSDTCGY